MRRETTALDDLMPEHDVRSRHAEVADAPIRAVWRELERFRVDDISGRAKALLALRGLPGPSGGTLRGSLYRAGFRVFVDRPNEELVVGIIGRFWALRERAALRSPTDASSFEGFDRPGWAKGAMSIRMEQLTGERTLIVTETRVLATDARSRRRFAAYWALIRPFSGWLRRELLRAVALRAEEAA